MMSDRSVWLLRVMWGSTSSTPYTPDHRVKSDPPGMDETERRIKSTVRESGKVVLPFQAFYTI